MNPRLSFDGRSPNREGHSHCRARVKTHPGFTSVCGLSPTCRALTPLVAHQRLQLAVCTSRTELSSAVMRVHHRDTDIHVCTMSDCHPMSVTEPCAFSGHISAAWPSICSRFLFDEWHEETAVPPPMAGRLLPVWQEDIQRSVAQEPCTTQSVALSSNLQPGQS